MSDNRDTLSRLKQLARERWGEEWAIEQRHWADGTTSEHAYHTIGPVDVDDVDQKVRECEYLWLNEEGQHVVERIQLTAEEAIHREIVADPFDLVDEDYLEWSWVKDTADRWHRVSAVIEKEGGDKRELVCGDVLEDDEIEEMTMYDPSDQDYQPVELCHDCAASR